MIKTLDIGRYEENAIKSGWYPAYKSRWEYHAKAIEVVKTLDLDRAREVLEIGSFGAQIVVGSNTLDMEAGDVKKPFHPTYLHDARALPWPIETGQYSLLIALRVWQHLAPVQEQCFREAKRIAGNVLIVCPESEPVGRPIKRAQFIEWNDGAAPVEEYPMGEWGRIYLWEGDCGR